MVVEDVWHRGSEVAVVQLVRFRVALLEEEELELGAEHGREPELLGSRDLGAQHLAR